MKFVNSSLIVFLIVLFVFPNQTFAARSPAVHVKSALIMDYATGKVMYARNAYGRRLPASTLKLLTAMTALDISSPEQRLTVSRRAADAQPSKAHLRPGESYRLKDLIKALLISSCNDAASCIGEGLGGTEYAFARRMTEKARSIGCKNSAFTNASGLPDDRQYTTAYDLALITRAAYKYPLIRECMATRHAAILRPCGQKIFLRNHNKMLWQGGLTVHGKTGFTRKARHCFACVATGNGRQVVMVMLGGSRSWTNIRPLVYYGLSITSKGSVLKQKAVPSKGKHSRKTVIRIQKALRKAGFSPGVPDGVFGPRTVDAVMKFQRRFGLAVDGAVGPKTLAKLQRYM